MNAVGAATGGVALSELDVLLFVANDLRIADAHDAVGESLQRLQDQGFDNASLHQGYGRALDFVLDGVINSFAALNWPLSRILARR